MRHLWAPLFLAACGRPHALENLGEELDSVAPVVGSWVLVATTLEAPYGETASVEQAEVEVDDAWEIVGSRSFSGWASALDPETKEVVEGEYETTAAITGTLEEASDHPWVATLSIQTTENVWNGEPLPIGPANAQRWGCSVSNTEMSCLILEESEVFLDVTHHFERER